MGIDTDVVESIVGSVIQAGDRITIDTRFGEKSAMLYRGSVGYNIINSLGLLPDWVLIHQGENELAFNAETGLENVTASIFYQILYAGV